MGALPAAVAGAASENAGDGPGEDRTDRAPAAEDQLSQIQIWNLEPIVLTIIESRLDRQPHRA